MLFVVSETPFFNIKFGEEANERKNSAIALCISSIVILKKRIKFDIKYLIIYKY